MSVQRLRAVRESTRLFRRAPDVVICEDGGLRSVSKDRQLIEPIVNTHINHSLSLVECGFDCPAVSVASIGHEAPVDPPRPCPVCSTHVTHRKWWHVASLAEIEYNLFQTTHPSANTSISDSDIQLSSIAVDGVSWATQYQRKHTVSGALKLTRKQMWPQQSRKYCISLIKYGHRYCAPLCSPCKSLACTSLIYACNCKLSCSVRSTLMFYSPRHGWGHHTPSLT